MEGFLKYVSDKSNITATEIISLPSIPAGNENIGYVRIAGSVGVNPLPAGNKTIGDVGLVSSLPAGSNTIGNVTVSGGTSITNFPSTQNVALVSAIPAGSKKIGSVNVSTLPSLTVSNFPTNQAATITNSTVSAAITSLPALPAGTNTIGNLAVTNFNSIVSIGNTAFTINDVFNSLQTSVWDISVGAGDIVQVDGNTLGCQYLVISKDPLAPGSSSSITSRATFTAPFDISAGVSMSRRQVGIDASIQVVSTEDPIVYNDIEVSGLSQTTTTLTVTTLTAHGLSVGDRIGIRGYSNTNLNYPALIVATLVSTTQFTVTNTPDAIIASLTTGVISVSPGTTYVFRRPTINNIPNGASLNFDMNLNTQGAPYLADGGKYIPATTTYGTSHAITIGSTASVVAASGVGLYAYQPTTEYRFQHLGDQFAIMDCPIDTSAYIQRSRRTQVVPDPSKSYKLRFTARTSPSSNTMIPIASATKVNGSTTLTVVTDVPHGFQTGMQVNILYGSNPTVMVNNQSQSNTITVVDSVTFTIPNYNTTGGTSYGGIAMLANGQINTTSGHLTGSSIYASVSRTSNLISVPSTAGIAAALLIGDYVNMVGFRNSTTGAKLNIDGAYRVRDSQTTFLTLEPLTNDLLGADFAAVACGGGVVKRLDYRIHFARAIQTAKQRIEANQMTGFPIMGVNPVPAALTTNMNPVLFGGTDSTSSTIRRLLTDTSGALAASIPNTIVDVAPGTAFTILNLASNLTATSILNQVDYSVAITIGTISAGATFDLGIEDSDDTGSWYRVYDFPRITSANNNTIIRSPRLAFNGGRGLRYVQLLTGTTGNTITRGITRYPYSTSSPAAAGVKQIYDRSINLSSIGSTTGSLFSPNSNRVQVTCTVTSSAVTPGSLQVQGSEDQVVWYPIGTLNTPINTTPVTATFNNVCATFYRVAVLTTPSSALATPVILIRTF